MAHCQILALKLKRILMIGANFLSNTVYFKGKSYKALGSLNVNCGLAL